MFKRKFFAINLLKLSINFLYLTLFLLIWHIFAQAYFLTNQYINIDLYSSIFKILIILTTIFILHNSIKYTIFHSNASFEYAFLVHFTTLFLVLLISSPSLILMFICILGFSLGLYILIMFDTPFKKSLEATIKYFYLSALSSGLIASGLFCTYL
jgi:NADH:ubiquinone oxidoreductase subunit 2 (subunit N)